MNHLQLAFIIGLLGSWHCVGMCGPLAFAIPGNTNKTTLVLEKLSYNLGRSISYAFLGLLIGLLGKQLWIAGFQQSLSIISGALIMMAAMIQLIPKLNSKIGFGKFSSFNPVQSLIIKAIKFRSGHFIIGMLNGFLPCGFVYLALATALNTSSATQSALFMFFFGLGTLPLMFIATLGFNFAKPSLRKAINNVLPWFMFLMGLWLILRGANLNIPFLSPVLSEGAICH